ncbi:DUF5979 domain-containing protein [Microbacterium hominis]|uniref:LPXTG cell wall anchor domain-containing protein n=1 Tax=Microbacterium hominis TaxID=162426 RepID=A0A7D4PZ83_9MICO|nr:DUF5979 domain-containing protein [Microbacterium hominis]QKJ18152.1 hypothetical protein HQM25_01130 [Microbacterium hominis]
MAWSAACALLAGMLVVAPAATPPAEAATLNVGPISAQFSGTRGTDGSNSSNRDECIRYAPAGTGGTTSLVGPGQEALTAHGHASGNRCPDQLSTRIQSAIGFTPSTTQTAQDGDTFLIGRFTHYNNVVSGSRGGAKHFEGSLRVQMGGFTPLQPTTFPWMLWETPNGDRPCAFLNGPNDRGCADEIRFTNQIADQVFDQQGFQYKLVVSGFIPTSAAACPATPAGSAVNRFLTRESANSAACLYASLVQRRELTIVKQVAAPAGTTIPAFAYTGTSDLAGSPWATKKFSLTPGVGTSDSEGPVQLLRGETVSVTEAPVSDEWSTTSIECLDTAGNPVPEASYDLDAGKLTLDAVGAPPTTDALGIVCTYTNTFTPKASLTLVKQVDGGDASPAAWTLSAVGPDSIGGASGSAAVTSRRVAVGTYALNEAGGPTGYSAGTWSCENGSITGSRVTLERGANAVCTIVNTSAPPTGSLTVTKAITGPDGGFTGDDATPFHGAYRCDGADAVAFTVSRGTPFVSPPLPAGASCVVTETPPTGSLLDGSFSWQPAAFVPTSATAEIPSGGTATVAITNSFIQRGSIEVRKIVEPRPGTPAVGYTGGAARVFPVTYECTLGGVTVAGGALELTTTGSAIVWDLPTGASCAFDETLAPAAGDFANDTYQWDGSSWSEQTVPVPGSTTPASTTLTNFFTRLTGELVLTKNVLGDGFTGGTSAVFEIAYDCGAGFSGTRTLAAGASTTVTGIPAGTQCRVTETAPTGNLQTGYEWALPVYDGLVGGVVTVLAGGSSTVAVTNRPVRQYGELIVGKQITPAELRGGVLASARFEVMVTCDQPAQGQASPYSATFSLAVDASATTPRLPIGTQCDVTETAPAQALLVDESYSWGATPAAQTVTVDSTAEAVFAAVVNSVQREVGSFQVRKQVNGIGPADGAQTTFSGTWSCQYGTDTPLTGEWSVTGAGDAVMTGPATAIPLGSICIATEEAIDPAVPIEGDPAFIWGGTDIDGPLTLTAAAPNGASTVENNVAEVDGAFSISKKVKGGKEGAQFTGTFTFEYSCLAAAGGTFTGSVVVAAGATADVSAIPAGSECTITETAKGAEIDPYRWTDLVGFSLLGATPTNTTDTSVTFLIPDDGSHVAVRATNDIVRVTVPVSVQKLLDPDTPGGVVTGGGLFPISLVCGAETFGPYQLTIGQSVSVPVPLGATCEVAEGAVPATQGLAAGWIWNASPVLSAQVTIADENGTYAASVTNAPERQFGRLRLVKVVDEGAYPGTVDPGIEYEGTWSCVYPGEQPVTGTWSVEGPGEATLVGVPAAGIAAGSTCTPTEETPDEPTLGADPSFTWALPPTLDAASIGAGETGTMQVTNILQRDTGQISARKVITGETAGYTGGADLVFPIDFSCTTPAVEGEYIGRGLFAASTDPDAAPTVFTAAIPNGWECTFAEGAVPDGLLRDASFAWGAPVIGPAVVTVDGTDTPTVTVTNPIVRRIGTFTVFKSFTAVVPESATTGAFSGTYSCVYGEGESFEQTFSGTWTANPTGPDGAQATLDPVPTLPIGSECSLTETAPTTAEAPLPDASYRWGAPAIPDPVTIAQGVPSTMPVINTTERVYGAAQLQKAYTGVDGALLPGTVVTGTWSCEYGGAEVADGVWELPASGGTVSLFGATDQVPVTATCVVGEDTLDDADLVDASFTWNRPVLSPESGEFTATEQTTAVTVTNSTTRAFGPFEITKRVTAPEGVPVETGLVFDGTWRCQYGADGPVAEGQWSVIGEGTYRVDGILVGSACTIEENSQRAAAPVPTDFSYVWNAPVITAPQPVAREGEAVANGTVDNPVRRVLTGFSISKIGLVPGGTAPSGALFTFDWSCVSESGEVYEGTREIGPGGTTRIADIPASSECTVTEREPAAAGGLDWAFRDWTLSGVADAVLSVSGRSLVFAMQDPQPDLEMADVVVAATNTATPQQGPTPPITPTPTPGQGPTPTPTPGTALPPTGLPDTVWTIAWAGFLAMLAGAVAFGFASRRRIVRR